MSASPTTAPAATATTPAASPAANATPTEVARRVRGWLEGETDRLLALVEALVRVESPSLDPGSQGPVLDLLTSALEESGLEVRRLSGDGSGGHLLAHPPRPRRSRPRQPAQLLLGHCDTVWPRGTLASMPWTLEGEQARGPGVYDMKAGLALGVFALRALAALVLEPSVTPCFFINSDEEIGSRDSRRRIERLARVMDRVLVLEPSLGRDGRLKTARKGVGLFTVKVRGRAAHAGLDPERGASAILELSYAIQQLFALNDPARGVTVNVGQIDGGLRPNVVAPESRAMVDVRVLTTEDGERVEAAIRALEPRTPGVTLEIEGGVGRPPMEPTPRNRALWLLAHRLGCDLGLELEEATAGGGSDGNFTSRWTATLDGLGAVGDGAHAVTEFVDTRRLVERAALVALLLLAPPLATLEPPSTSEEEPR